MKPHEMFFDETYSEHYYRSDTVKEYLNGVDCLIVVGTALETNLARNILTACLSQDDVPVIEVCYPESCIDRGFNL
jgi:NAD-dependent SIR2 family protein deacetylase